MMRISTYAQTTVTSILNSTGSTADKGTFNLEWNVGEAVLIHTASSSSYMISQGLLQGYQVNKPTVVHVLRWQPEDIRIFPNPVHTTFNFELFSSLKGELFWTLLDSKGVAIKEGNFNYYGEGHSEKIDITNFPAGVYVLNVSIRHFNSINKNPYRNSGLKIIKLHQ